MHGGRMEAEVHQPLGNVHHLDAHGLEGFAVEDELMGVHALLVLVHHPVAALLQPLGHVVGVQDGHLGGRAEAGSAHPVKERNLINLNLKCKILFKNS